MKQFARLLLEEGTTNLVGACVNVNDELPIGLWQGKYRWAQQCVAKVFECSDGHVRRWWKIRWDLGPSQGVQGLRSFGKVLDETSIDVAHARDAFELGLCSWELGMLQSIHVLVVPVQLPGADNVSEVLDLIGEPRALFQVEGKPGFAETVKNRVNFFDVLFRVCGEDDDIVSVDKAYLPL